MRQRHPYSTGTNERTTGKCKREIDIRNNRTYRAGAFRMRACQCSYYAIYTAKIPFIYGTTLLQFTEPLPYIHISSGLWSRSRRLGLETYQRLVSVSSREKLSTSRSRLGLGHLRLVLKTNFRPNSAGHSTQCERALKVVSLCCSSYFCSSY